ncbi:MAG: exopolysaccharide biosynthesis polyprenyl glycosylphosphotransferase [Phaeodactylibacter sp.]|nr:exopolysaccharide biosynthesis polyprenyl glycosylphosphotransferase [Phaeodactylibacter sp.]MCB9298509.1 exopolysaccharide biosynthesis polyprenyl glycosylphosphotransferase [Lewinellaceae bacterium]
MIPKNRHLAINHVALEFLLLNLCLLAVFLFRLAGLMQANPHGAFNGDFLWLAAIFNLSWGLIIFLNGDLDLYLNFGFRKRMKYVVLNTFIFVGITYTLGMLFHIEFIQQTSFLIPIFLFLFINLSLFEFYGRKRRNVTLARALVVGKGEEWSEIAGFAGKIRRRGYDLVGFLDNQKQQDSDAPVLGKVDDLSSVLGNTEIDEIFVTVSSLNEEEVKRTIEAADYYGIRVNLLPGTPNVLVDGVRPSYLEGLPVIRVRQTPLDKLHCFLLKKVFDFVFALGVLIALSPIFAVIAALIYMDNKGPIFYKPVRKGEAGGSFQCYKFRTMSVCDDPLNGTKSTVKNDPRITRVGKYLRKYDLDELPQFINVLKGDMSVVGPRPHRVFLEQDFRKVVNDYMVRHYVKPGVTGWAQVNGWRGPTVTNEQKRQRIKHDLWYIENWSFWMDIKIVFLTVFSKKTRKNAF